MTPSTSHLVVLPTYNSGPRLLAVVAEVLRHWRPVLVVVDGSTDGSAEPVRALASTEPDLTVLVLPRNAGKGAAVLAGAQAARARGFTHALVMDADGQHPAASIGEFMAASAGRPAALILGQPVFPPNMPAARRHGRKLSIALVRFEVLGAGVADPLFGFRVYPLDPLLAALGPRRGGRRYDFDTEAAVRLCWAGVTPVNRPAPVRYFSTAEGGVSHFHYVRDNVTLVWLHTRLIAELVLRRWPAVRRHRALWPATGLALALLLAGGPVARGDVPDPLVNAAHRLAPGAPAWRDLAEAFAHHPDTTADFVERRFFPFKTDPVELRGEVRVAAGLGLSLHYRQPEERTVILDGRGLLVRAAGRDQTPPADPRATAANEALLHLLQFDFAALETDFELYGQRAGAGWTMVLVPRAPALQRAIGRITAEGNVAAVRRIELRRSARQYIEIRMDAPRPPADFTAEERARYFR